MSVITDKDVQNAQECDQSDLFSILTLIEKVKKAGQKGFYHNDRNVKKELNLQGEPPVKLMVRARSVLNLLVRYGYLQYGQAPGKQYSLYYTNQRTPEITAQNLMQAINVQPSNNQFQPVQPQYQPPQPQVAQPIQNQYQSEIPQSPPQSYLPQPQPQSPTREERKDISWHDQSILDMGIEDNNAVLENAAKAIKAQQVAIMGLIESVKRQQDIYIASLDMFCDVISSCFNEKMVTEVRKKIQEGKF